MGMMQAEKAPRMNGRGFQFIAIGFLFLFMNIRIAQVDLLIFIGYIFIFYGSLKLQRFSVYFKKIRWVEVLLLCNSFLNIYAFSYPAGSAPTAFTVYSICMRLFMLPVSILFYYYLIRGMQEITTFCGVQKYTLWGNRMLVCMLSVQCLGLGMSLAAHFLTDVTIFTFLPILIINSVVWVFFLVFVWKVYRTLNGRQLVRSLPINTYPVKSAAPFMTVCALVTLLVFGGTMYFYIDSICLFPRSAFPSVLTQAMEIDRKTFKRPVWIEAVKITEQGIGRTEMREPNEAEPAMKKLLEKVAAGLEHAEQGQGADIGIFRLIDYHLTLNSQRNQLHIWLVEEQNIIMLDDIYYILQAEDMQELLQFVQETFVFENSNIAGNIGS